MANISNLNAEIGANFIGDDAQPAVAFSNSSTGPGLRVFGLVGTSSATIDALTIGGPIPAAAATISNFNIAGASRPSGAIISFRGDALASCATILATTGGVAGTWAIRVSTTNGQFGWIPVYPDAAVTAAAVP